MRLVNSRRSAWRRGCCSMMLVLLGLCTGAGSANAASHADTPATTAPCVLRFALDTPFPPHILFAADGQPHGINVQMIQLLAAEVGCRVRFVRSPWARSLKLLQQGELDVISQLTYNPQRAESMAFIGPHLTERMWLIADPTKVPALQQLTDLTSWPLNVQIAVLNGAYFGEALQLLRDDPLQRRRFYPMVSNQDKLALLESGRVQAVLEEELAWQFRIAGQPTPFQPLLLVHAAPVYFGFSRKSVSPELLQQLTLAWQRLYHSGQLEQIRRKYLAVAQGMLLQIAPLPTPASLLAAPAGQPLSAQPIGSFYAERAT